MMGKNNLRLGAALGLAVAMLTSLAVVGPGKSESSAKDTRLDVSIVATNRGPLPACSGYPACTPANAVWHFIYIKNKNPLTNLAGGTTRATLPNSFVVSSVEWTIFADGVEITNSTFTPPPNANWVPWSGHWPSTVTCTGLSTPCNIVGNPAVVPGENTAILYAGWVHTDFEVNGLHLFRYTIHGTLNGTPVDLIANSPPILMTD